MSIFAQFSLTRSCAVRPFRAHSDYDEPCLPVMTHAREAVCQNEIALSAPHAIGAFWNVRTYLYTVLTDGRTDGWPWSNCAVSVKKINLVTSQPGCAVKTWRPTSEVDFTTSFPPCNGGSGRKCPDEEETWPLGNEIHGE